MNEIIITDGAPRQRCDRIQDVTPISVERTAL